MTRLSVSAATLAALGLVASIPFAAPAAFAGGGKPAPAATPAAKPAAEKYASLADLEAAADAAEAAAQKDLRRARYEKVVAYLAASPDAKDREQAVGTAMDLAEEVEEWAKAVEHADAYLKAYEKGERRVEVLLTKAGALTHVGTKEATKAAYGAAFDAVDVEKTNPNLVLGAYSSYADYLVDQNDLEGAKAAYQACKDKYASHEASNQIAGLVESWAKNLEMVGLDAIAIPANAKDLDGKPVTLADYKGKVLLIDFWATWCGPCRAEMPNVIKAYTKYHAKGFEVLGISLDRPNDVEKLKSYIKEKAMPWRQVHYSEGPNDVASAYGVEGIPHTVLIGGDGKVIRIGLRGAALEKTLERLFK
ncbi:MAG: TlpA family protein disulfide reductase [Planctomycetia bacterium]|nr:TlpA family protein disulfide reductase [Planctomycetia bacterium]